MGAILIQISTPSMTLLDFPLIHSSLGFSYVVSQMGLSTVVCHEEAMQLLHNG